jgi:AbiTii
VENRDVLQQQTDRLAALEREARDRAVPLADVLRSFLVLAEQTQAVKLRGWATAELEGYWPFNAVPEYRRVPGPILETFDVPYRGLVTQFLNVQTLPEGIRERLNAPVPLNQSVDELEALAKQYEAQGKPLQLEVFGSDFLMATWNKNNPGRPPMVAMTWAIDPPVIRGVLGRVRTKLTQFVVELRTEIGDSNTLPSAAQADEVLQAIVPWTVVINNSTVTIVTATTKNGDIMPEGPRTTIKGNKTEISGATGNVSVASANVAQVSGDGVDVEKIRQFAGLLAQIAPTLGLSADQQVELEAGVGELQAAVAAPTQDKGRFRSALDRVLRVLRAVGTSTAQEVVVSMGDELVRELSSEIIRDLPH